MKEHGDKGTCSYQEEIKASIPRPEERRRTMEETAKGIGAKGINLFFPLKGFDAKGFFPSRLLPRFHPFLGSFTFLAL